MNEIIIKTEKVTRTFKSGGETVHALRGVSLEIPKGKLTVLRGRSGSGKTTLLNIMSGLDKPTEGRVFFNGEDISAMLPSRRDRLRGRSMGFVFQSIALMPDMDAVENIEYSLRIAKAARRGVRKKDMPDNRIGGIGTKGARGRIEECLKKVGLEKRIKHLASELSGGEQQRVAIARSFAHKPLVVFADEPTAELDTATGIQVVDIFKQLISSEGLTVVMTTHDPNMLELADKVYTLTDGMITDGND